MLIWDLDSWRWRISQQNHRTGPSNSIFTNTIYIIKFSIEQDAFMPIYLIKLHCSCITNCHFVAKKYRHQAKKLPDFQHSRNSRSVLISLHPKSIFPLTLLSFQWHFSLSFCADWNPSPKRFPYFSVHLDDLAVQKGQHGLSPSKSTYASCSPHLS